MAVTESCSFSPDMKAITGTQILIKQGTNQKAFPRLSVRRQKATKLQLVAQLLAFLALLH